MEIHPPHGPIRSVKEFLLQLLTITIGILVALSLEGVIQWRHHRHLVQEAEANLATEIRDNQRELRTGLDDLKTSKGQLNALASLVHQLEADRKTRVGNVSFNWSVQTLHATSWNTAAATGAVSYMSYERAKRYTRIYDLQQQYLTTQDRAFAIALSVQGLQILLGKDMKKVSNAQLEEAERLVGLLANASAMESIATVLNDEYSKFLEAK